MPELLIPFDPCNPGQFYACCGLMELFDLSGAKTLSYFEINPGVPRKGTFVLASASQLDWDLIARALKVSSYEYIERQRANDQSKSSEGDKPDDDETDKIQPVRVSIFAADYFLDWWLDWYWDKKSSLKLWPGKATSETVIESLRKYLPDVISAERPFESGGAFLKSRFGVDPRSAWDSIDLGFSPHKQNQSVLTYPLVEMLAAFGLQGFRPGQVTPNTYEYCLWRSPLPLAVARSACVQPWDGLGSLAYLFPLKQRSSFSKCFGFAEINPI